MPDILNSSDRVQLENLVNSGNRLGYYSYLENKGYSYASLAKGVVDGSTLSGRMANAFLVQEAQDIFGTTLSSQQVEQISLNLMQADFTMRFDTTNSASSGQILSAENIQTYHKTVFEDAGLGIEVWTAHEPLEVFARNYQALGYASAADARNAAWEMMSTDGDIANPVNSIQLYLIIEDLGYKKFGELFPTLKDFDAAEWVANINQVLFQNGGYIIGLDGKAYQADECFPAHTPITLSDGGTKPISEIQIGNSVLAFDAAGRLHARKVTKLFTNVTEHFYKLSSSDLKEDLVVTSGHRFALPEGGFETIEAILQRDGRIVLENGDVVIVIGELLEYNATNAELFEQITLSKSITEGNLAAKPQDVTGWKTYTFEVEELHSYEAANDNTLIRKAA